MKYDMRDLAFFLRQWKTESYIMHRERRIMSVAPIYNLEEYVSWDDILFVISPDQMRQNLEKKPDLNVLTSMVNFDHSIVEEYPDANFIVVCEDISPEEVGTILSNHIMKRDVVNVPAVLLETLTANTQKGGTLVNTIAQLFGNPVITFDLGMDIIVASKFEWDPEEIARNFEKWYSLSPAELEKIKEAVVLRGSDPKMPRCMIIPMFVGSTRSGFVAVFEKRCMITDSDMSMTEMIGKTCGIEMQKSDRYRFETGFRHEYLLVKLIENKGNTKQYINSALKHQGISVTGNLFVAAFKVLPHQRDKRILMRNFAHELSVMLHGKLSAVYRDHIIILFACEGEVPLTVSERQRVEEYLCNRGILGGVSQRFERLIETNKYYRQALDMLTLAKTMRKTNYLFFMQDYIIYEMLANLSMQKDPTDYIDPRVSTLLSNDEMYGTQYIETLSALADNCLNMKKAAAELHIHRNTLLYRIEKIRKLTDFDLEDGDHLFQIQLSLKILEFMSTIK